MRRERVTHVRGAIKPYFVEGVQRVCHVGVSTRLLTAPMPMASRVCIKRSFHHRHVPHPAFAYSHPPTTPHILFCHFTIYSRHTQH